MIESPKAAAFEPNGGHSGYEYLQNLSYYHSVRDAGSQFFAESIPAGKSSISYEMIVAHEGDFTEAPATLQCMYKPEVAAHSNRIAVHITQ
jgi:hypothetical protein